MNDQTELTKELKCKLFLRLFMKNNLTENEHKIFEYLNLEPCVQAEFALKPFEVEKLLHGNLTYDRINVEKP